MAVWIATATRPHKHNLHTIHFRLMRGCCLMPQNIWCFKCMFHHSVFSYDMPGRWDFFFLDKFIEVAPLWQHHIWITIFSKMVGMNISNLMDSKLNKKWKRLRHLPAFIFIILPSFEHFFSFFSFHNEFDIIRRKKILSPIRKDYGEPYH